MFKSILAIALVAALAACSPQTGDESIGYTAPETEQVETVSETESTYQTTDEVTGEALEIERTETIKSVEEVPVETNPDAAEVKQPQ